MSSPGVALTRFSTSRPKLITLIMVQLTLVLALWALQIGRASCRERVCHRV